MAQTNLTVAQGQKMQAAVDAFNSGCGQLTGVMTDFAQIGGFGQAEFDSVNAAIAAAAPALTKCAVAISNASDPLFVSGDTNTTSNVDGNPGANS
jgi:hypothetical protein